MPTRHNAQNARVVLDFNGVEHVISAGCPRNRIEGWVVMRAMENAGQYTRELRHGVKQWMKSDFGQLMTWLAAFAVVTLCFAGIGLLKDHLQ